MVSVVVMVKRIIPYSCVTVYKVHPSVGEAMMPQAVLEINVLDSFMRKLEPSGKDWLAPSLRFGLHAQYSLYLNEPSLFHSLIPLLFNLTVEVTDCFAGRRHKP